jgi:hypothetical protein
MDHVTPSASTCTKDHDRGGDPPSSRDRSRPTHNPEHAEACGLFFVECAVGGAQIAMITFDRIESSAESYNAEAQRCLWLESERMTGVPVSRACRQLETY